MPRKPALIKIIIRKIQSNEKLYKSFNYSNPLQKYSITEYLKDILYVLKTGIAWRDIRSPIGWNSIYKVYRKLVKHNILRDCYNDLASGHFKKSSKRKLKILITDTSFVPNKNGKEVIGKNRYYNKKNGTKISLITNDKGTPINATCRKGNRNDAKILEKDLDKINKNTQIKYVIKSKNKKYFLADAEYDTKAINDTITGMNYKYIVANSFFFS